MKNHCSCKLGISHVTYWELKMRLVPGCDGKYHCPNLMEINGRSFWKLKINPGYKVNSNLFWATEDCLKKKEELQDDNNLVVDLNTLILSSHLTFLVCYKLPPMWWNNVHKWLEWPHAQRATCIVIQPRVFLCACLAPLLPLLEASHWMVHFSLAKLRVSLYASSPVLLQEQSIHNGSSFDLFIE